MGGYEFGCCKSLCASASLRLGVERVLGMREHFQHRDTETQGRREERQKRVT